MTENPSHMLQTQSGGQNNLLHSKEARMLTSRYATNPHISIWVERHTKIPATPVSLDITSQEQDNQRKGESITYPWMQLYESDTETTEALTNNSLDRRVS
ncbi:hypothetical protein M404DRAFT_824986 [Pisolithus tinctorius Marx 270]|uniref:Uncharacterized protein n=1 Tax=Pisolithus tinctorius Marx 270 TaxID=870435 RepID=A0A0C3NUH9_PISTI|nr:hypothetical protein M404DRAFT_824986 [Pisolithus tinctorius Marx 270]